VGYPRGEDLFHDTGLHSWVSSVDAVFSVRFACVLSLVFAVSFAAREGVASSLYS